MEAEPGLVLKLFRMELPVWVIMSSNTKRLESWKRRFEYELWRVFAFEREHSNMSFGDFAFVIDGYLIG